MEEIRNKVNAVIAETLRHALNEMDLRPEMHLIDDLKADSLQLMEIYLTLGAEFAVEIDRNDVFELLNLNNIYEYIQAKSQKAVA